MQVKELGHLVLYVKDVQRSADVLRAGSGLGASPGPTPRGCGPRPSARAGPTTSSSSSRWGRGPPPQPAGRRLGLYHFGLKVGDTDDELREAVARLEEAGVPIVGAGDHTVTHSVYILDPDGNEIELYIDVAGVDWKSDPGLLMTPVKPLAL